MQKMSVRKQRIAKKLEVLDIAFDGQKVNGVYKIGIVTFKTLDEIEVYIKECLEKVDTQQSAPEAVVASPVEGKKVHYVYASCKECKKVFKHFEINKGQCRTCREMLEAQRTSRFKADLEASRYLHEPMERRLIDECVARAKKLGRAFTEHEVFQEAWDKGYELMPAMDRRFVLIKDRVDGMPLWGLAGA